MTRHQFAGAAPTVHLSGLIDSAAVAATASESCSAYPDGSVGPFVIVFEHGTPSEEKVLCSGRTGAAFTITSRGYDGTTATSHSSGATVDHVLDSVVIDAHDAHMNDTTRNDHTQYQKNSDVRKLTIQLAADGVAVRLGSASDNDALNVTPYGAAAAVIASGAEFSGTTSTARATSATQLEFLNGELVLYSDTSLTPGNTYTRTQRFRVTTTGTIVSGSAVALPATASRVIAVSNIGTTIGFSDMPGAGGWLWVEGGELRYKGSSGTVTTIAPA